MGLPGKNDDGCEKDLVCLASIRKSLVKTAVRRRSIAEWTGKHTGKATQNIMTFITKLSDLHPHNQIPNKT
jgi:hypothetical protein